MNSGGATNAARPTDPRITSAVNAENLGQGLVISVERGSHLGQSPARATQGSTNTHAADVIKRLRILEQRNHQPSAYALLSKIGPNKYWRLTTINPILTLQPKGQRRP